MKVTFIHTGDIHLGRQFHFFDGKGEIGNNKRTDLWNTFEKILNTAEKNKIHFLLISGDFFDSDEIDIATLKRVAQRFGGLSMTQVVICPGNHDYYHPFSLYGLIEWPENVTIFQSGKLEEKDFPELGTVIYGVGWIKDTYNDCPFKEHLDLKEETNNILMLHGDAYDTTSDYMPLDISDYNYFDYVALGHIHKSDFMTNRVAYCGSPEPLSFKDEGDHGVIVGQVENHRCSAHFISTQNRKFITKTVAVDPDMTMDDLERVCLHVALDDERFKNYYRIRLEGYYDTSISMDWLREELGHRFYYLEIDDSALEPDFDIDSILEDNKDNVIGRFIQEMRRNGSDPIAKKALYYGLEGILREGGIAK